MVILTNIYFPFHLIMSELSGYNFKLAKGCYHKSCLWHNIVNRTYYITTPFPPIAYIHCKCKHYQQRRSNFPTFIYSEKKKRVISTTNSIHSFHKRCCCFCVQLYHFRIKLTMFRKFIFFLLTTTNRKNV